MEVVEIEPESAFSHAQQNHDQQPTDPRPKRQTIMPRGSSLTLTCGASSMWTKTRQKPPPSGWNVTRTTEDVTT